MRYKKHLLKTTTKYIPSKGGDNYAIKYLISDFRTCRTFERR